MVTLIITTAAHDALVRKGANPRNAVPLDGDWMIQVDDEVADRLAKYCTSGDELSEVIVALCNGMLGHS